MALKQTNKNRTVQSKPQVQPVISTVKVKTPVSKTYLNTRPVKHRKMPVSAVMFIVMVILLFVISFL